MLLVEELWWWCVGGAEASGEGVAAERELSRSAER